MPTSTLHSVPTLVHSRSATSLSRKSAARRNKHHLPGARKRFTSPSPQSVPHLGAARHRRHSNAIPHRRATSPSPVRGNPAARRARPTSPSPALGRDARLRRQSPSQIFAREARLRRQSPNARFRHQSPNARFRRQSPNSRFRRQSPNARFRRQSPNPLYAARESRFRRQSPNLAFGRDARLRHRSPLQRSHSTGSLGRTASLRRSTTSASSLASRRAQKKARAAARQRLVRSKSANSLARKKINAATNAKSVSSAARTRSQYYIQPMALGEPTTGPIAPRAGGVTGLFRRKNTGGGLGALFGKKSPTPAAVLAPSPKAAKRPSPAVGGGLEKALVPRAAHTMTSGTGTVSLGTQALVQRRAGRPMTIAERKRAMALAARTHGNTRQLRTVRYGASGPNGSMMMKRAVMATGGGIRVGPSPSTFPGMNGGSRGSSGMRSVLLDGECIGNYGDMMPLGFDAVKAALMFYKMKGVEVCAIVDEITCMEWEGSSGGQAEAIGQLRAAGMLLVPPAGSDCNRFLLKIADQFEMDIVSNNQFAMEKALEEIDFLETKLIPYMIVKDEFIPHPEEGRILTGLHGPRPPEPTMMMGTGTGGGAIGPIGGTRGGGGGAIMGLPPGAGRGGGGSGAMVPMKMRGTSGQRVAAIRAAAAATARKRNLYQKRMQSVTQQQQIAQRRRKVAQLQKMQTTPLLQLTR